MVTINYIDKASHWSEYNSPDFSLSLSHGKYTLEHRRNSGSCCSFLSFRSLNSTPYNIKTELKCISASEETWYGIIWGLQNITNFTTLQISGKGDSYRLGEHHRGIFRCESSWSKTNKPINENQLVEIQIAVDIDTYSSRFVMTRHNTYSQNFYSQSLGKGIGFICGPNCRLEINSLFISDNPGIRSFYNCSSLLENQEFTYLQDRRRMEKSSQ